MLRKVIKIILTDSATSDIKHAHLLTATPLLSPFSHTEKGPSSFLRAGLPPMYLLLVNTYNVGYPFSPFDIYPLALNRILFIGFKHQVSLSIQSLSLLIPYSLPAGILSPSLNCPCAPFFSPPVSTLTRLLPPSAFQLFSLSSPLLSRSLSHSRLFARSLQQH